MILFDHIAIAVPRLADAPAVLVGPLGGAPAYGAPSGPYRFFQWRYANGGRLEVLGPAGADGFLHRSVAIEYASDHPGSLADGPHPILGATLIRVRRRLV